MPEQLLKICGPMIIGGAWRYEATEPFFQSLQSVAIEEHVARVRYGHLDVNTGFVRDTLVGMGVLEDLEPATRAHVERLILLAEQNPSLSFAQCMEAAFAEAKARSEDGGAIQENRAAILAMGYLLGHPRIKPFLGPSVPSPPNDVWQSLGGVTLRNRHDWTRHYMVSAALQVIGNTLVSLDVGILKEELDAHGGTGFSFGDLLADRAGTMLAVRATESEAAAKAIQNRLANGFVTEDFMPEGSDLPEGLTDQRFQTSYGGVGGKEYTRLLTEIDRRIEECAAFKNRP